MLCQANVYFFYFGVRVNFWFVIVAYKLENPQTHFIHFFTCSTSSSRFTKVSGLTKVNTAQVQSSMTLKFWCMAAIAHHKGLLPEIKTYHIQNDRRGEPETCFPVILSHSSETTQPLLQCCWPFSCVASMKIVNLPTDLFPCICFLIQVPVAC